MYFDTKSYLKNIHNHTVKHTLLANHQRVHAGAPDYIF